MECFKIEPSKYRRHIIIYSHLVRENWCCYQCTEKFSLNTDWLKIMIIISCLWENGCYQKILIHESYFGKRGDFRKSSYCWAPTEIDITLAFSSPTGNNCLGRWELCYGLRSPGNCMLDNLPRQHQPNSCLNLPQGKCRLLVVG